MGRHAGGAETQCQERATGTYCLKHPVKVLSCDRAFGVLLRGVHRGMQDMGCEAPHAGCHAGCHTFGVTCHGCGVM